MNLFYLDESPDIAATYHCDSHNVKMILEVAQLLSTAHRVLDGTERVELSKAGRKIKRYDLMDSREEVMYKATHMNHPSAVWVRESRENYEWAYALFKALCNEYSFRYGKIHACEEKLMHWLDKVPNNIPIVGKTPVRIAINEEIYGKVDKNNPVMAYRRYYRLKDKQQFSMTWTKRDKPFFMMEEYDAV